jgi:hypothetical protein
VWALIGQEIAAETQQADTSEFDFAASSREIEALREQIRARQVLSPLDVVGMLRDIRDGEDE